MITPELNEAVLQVFGALLQLLFVVLGILSGYLAWKLKTYISAKVGVEQYDWLKRYAMTTVEALSQNPAFADFKGEQLKAEAVARLVEFANKNGFTYTPSQIDGLIEAAVKGMKLWEAEVEVE